VQATAWYGDIRCVHILKERERRSKAEEAGLFEAGLFMNTTALEVGARSYWIEFAKPPRVISARTVSPTFFCFMYLVPCPT
jgi:hypothetical protein